MGFKSKIQVHIYELKCVVFYNTKQREGDFEMSNFQTVKPPTVRAALSKNTLYAR